MAKDTMFKFENRAERVFNAQYETYVNEIKIFYDFINSDKLLNLILLELEALPFNQQVEEYINECLKKVNKIHLKIEMPSNNLDRVITCNYIMKAYRDNKMSIQVTGIDGLSTLEYQKKGVELIMELHFRPLYYYFLEKIDNNNNILFLLDKYRHRVEWFHKEQLRDMYNDNTKIGEAKLKKDLEEYLHNQGIDYPFSDPISPSGKVDLVDFSTPDPLVLEVKIFNGKGYDRSYIRKGFNQVLKYASDYGKKIGYLLIYNLDKKERDLQFDPSPDISIKYIQYGEIRIYIICINFHITAASKAKKPKLYQITDKYLLNME